MTVEFDHMFICTQLGAPEADRLVAFGLSEGTPNSHPGQGTACRRFFFRNAMLELAKSEARSSLPRGSGSAGATAQQGTRPSASAYAQEACSTPQPNRYCLLRRGRIAHLTCRPDCTSTLPVKRPVASRGCSPPRLVVDRRPRCLPSIVNSSSTAGGLVRSHLCISRCREAGLYLVRYARCSRQARSSSTSVAST
jgi:hypothetical protein